LAEQGQGVISDDHGDPDQGGDSKPEKEHEHGYRKDVGNAIDAQLAGVRTRAEYYEALRAVDPTDGAAGKAEIASSTTVARSVWDAGEAGGHPDRPSLDSMRITPERARNILDGIPRRLDSSYVGVSPEKGT
jgi:hypothetical protein